MGRFLVVVPPVAGHVLPTVEVGRELTRRGHDVAWLSYRHGVEHVLPADARLLEVAHDVAPEITEKVARATARGMGGAAAFVRVWTDYFGPVAREMRPAVEEAVASFRPDVLLVDQQALAGAVVAHRHGIPWATSATTSAEIVARYARVELDPVLMAYARKAADWLRGYLADLLVELGLDPGDVDGFDPRFSPRLVLGYSTETFLGVDLDLPPNVALVGPSVGPRRTLLDFPWERLDADRPLVLVSLGTVNWRGGEAFFRAAAAAVAGLDVQAVLVCPDQFVEDPPANVVTAMAVPQLELLDRAAAVVSHAGHNTVVETLARGLPLVVCPIRDDQPIVAAQVVGAGAGILVRYKGVEAAELRAALAAVLTDPAHRRGAERVRDSFRAAGGPVAAADRLVALLPGAAADGEARPASPPP